MPVARISSLTPAQTKLARQGQAAMLAAERKTLGDLKGASELALQRLLRATEGMGANVRRSLLVASAGAAEELRHNVAAVVTSGRSAARQLAYNRLSTELALAARDLRLASIQGPPVSHDEASTAHAASAADSYVAAWRASVVLVARKAEGNISKPLRAASESQAHRLDRIAATEIPRAYNEAHDKGTDLVARRYADAKWLPFLVKRWDASLDRKTCTFCRDMHGAWAIIGMSFRGDVLPGEKHPFCRCTQSLIVPTPVTGFAVGYELAAA